jgi:hypothetical protein
MAAPRARELPTMSVGPVANAAVEARMRQKAEEKRQAALRRVTKSVDNEEPVSRQLSHLRSRGKRDAMMAGALCRL